MPSTGTRLWLRTDTKQVTIVSSSALSDFAHGGAGTCVMRYVRDGEILAEGVFELTPSAQRRLTRL